MKRGKKKMDKKVVVRLFYSPGCSGGCCSCGPDSNLEKFKDLAEGLADKFGEEQLTFEAYNSVDVKKFTFLRDLKTGASVKTPCVSVGEKIVSNGMIPSLSEIGAEIENILKKQ
jgi:hypothetical protein